MKFDKPSQCFIGQCGEQLLNVDGAVLLLHPEAKHLDHPGGLGTAHRFRLRSVMPNDP